MTNTLIISEKPVDFLEHEIERFQAWCCIDSVNGEEAFESILHFARLGAAREESEPSGFVIIETKHRHPVYNAMGVSVGVEDCQDDSCPGYTPDVEAVEP